MMPTIPGFRAELALASTSLPVSSILGSNESSLNAEVTPQRESDEFLCGMSLAAVAGGIAFVNPFAVVGGLVGALSRC